MNENPERGFFNRRTLTRNVIMLLFALLTFAVNVGVLVQNFAGLD